VVLLKTILSATKIGYLVISLLFMLSAVALVIFAGYQLWVGINPAGEAEMPARFTFVLEGIASLTIAVAALELGQTILEEEVQRDAHISAPTRVRRFLSRFMIVIVVSLSIEALVAVFHFVQEDPRLLPNAAWIGLVAAVLLASWGVFIHFNRGAEELEPEAMERAKVEDEKVEEGK
jgi:hypothetical protein